MTTWFTSDEHHWHANIIRYSKRPFSSIVEMTEELVHRHNAVVKAEDTVWHLGDFSMDERHVKVILPRLNGRHNLVAGNHDKCHRCHKRFMHMTEKYKEWGFKHVLQHASETLGADAGGLGGGVAGGGGPGGGDGGVTVRLNHLPYRGDTVTMARPNGEARYTEFRPADNGTWLLHGHVHDAWKVRKDEGKGGMINVGVDVWDFAPVAAETLVRIIRGAV